MLDKASVCYRPKLKTRITYALLMAIGYVIVVVIYPFLLMRRLFLHLHSQLR